MKRHEKLLDIIHWYQTETDLDPLTCRDDGTKLIGRAYLGSIYLECPQCGLRKYEIPTYVLELYYKENDIPTAWRIEEAKVLAEKLGRSVPESVLVSAMQLEQYIKSSRGKAIELGEQHGNGS